MGTARLSPTKEKGSAHTDPAWGCPVHVGRRSRAEFRQKVFMPDVLQFDSITHTYTLDGRRLESVTEVLEDVGLIEMPDAAPSVLEAARRRGTVVHEAVAYDTANDLDESSVPPEYMGYVLAARRFRMDTEFQSELVEHRGFHPQFQYAGTLDLKGTGKINSLRRRVLVDFKTGVALAWVRYQLAAYAGFFASPGAEGRVCVELHADGTYRQFTFAPETFRNDFDVFLSTLTIYRVKRLGEKLK